MVTFRDAIISVSSDYNQSWLVLLFSAFLDSFSIKYLTSFHLINSFTFPFKVFYRSRQKVQSNKHSFFILATAFPRTLSSRELFSKILYPSKHQQKKLSIFLIFLLFSCRIFQHLISSTQLEQRLLTFYPMSSIYSFLIQSMLL